MSKRKIVQSNCEAQVSLLSDDLKGLDPADPYYPMWIRLTAFLGSLCEGLAEVQVAVRGDGNGNRGLLERMTVVENSVKVSQSDIREVLNMLRQALGMDAESLAKKYDAENHPGRREADNQPKPSTFDKVVRYFVDKVLPQLIVWAILAYFAWQIALNEHIIIAK